jgi:hypothetical protein
MQRCYDNEASRIESNFNMRTHKLIAFKAMENSFFFHFNALYFIFSSKSIKPRDRIERKIKSLQLLSMKTFLLQKNHTRERFSALWPFEISRTFTTIR